MREVVREDSEELEIELVDRVDHDEVGVPAEPQIPDVRFELGHELQAVLGNTGLARMSLNCYVGDRLIWHVILFRYLFSR